MKQRIANKRLKNNILARLWIIALLEWKIPKDGNYFGLTGKIAEDMIKYDTVQLTRVSQKLGVRVYQLRKYIKTLYKILIT